MAQKSFNHSADAELLQDLLPRYTTPSTYPSQVKDLVYYMEDLSPMIADRARDAFLDEILQTANNTSKATWNEWKNNFGAPKKRSTIEERLVDGRREIMERLDIQKR